MDTRTETHITTATMNADDESETTINCTPKEGGEEERRGNH